MNDAQWCGGSQHTLNRDPAIKGFRCMFSQHLQFFARCHFTCLQGMERIGKFSVCCYPGRSAVDAWNCWIIVGRFVCSRIRYLYYYCGASDLFSITVKKIGRSKVRTSTCSPMKLTIRQFLISTLCALVGVLSLRGIESRTLRCFSMRMLSRRPHRLYPNCILLSDLFAKLLLTNDTNIILLLFQYIK